MTTPDGNDPIVDEVRDRILQMLQRCMAKYDTTLGRNDISTRAWLVHAIEEAIDLALYLTKLIRSEKP